MNEGCHFDFSTGFNALLRARLRFVAGKTIYVRLNPPKRRESLMQSRNCFPQCFQKVACQRKAATSGSAWQAVLGQRRAEKVRSDQLNSCGAGIFSSYKPCSCSGTCRDNSSALTSWDPLDAHCRTGFGASGSCEGCAARTAGFAHRHREK